MDRGERCARRDRFPGRKRKEARRLNGSSSSLSSNKKRKRRIYIYICIYLALGFISRACHAEETEPSVYAVTDAYRKF